MASQDRLHRRKFGKVLVLKFLLFGVLLLAVFGFVVMALWNWLTPPIFGLRTITYWQAVGLLILQKFSSAASGAGLGFIGAVTGGLGWRNVGLG